MKTTKNIRKTNTNVVSKKDLPYNFRLVTKEEREAWRVPHYGYIL